MGAAEDTKRKQKPKHGKVVRLSEYAWSFLSSRLESGETIKQAVDAMVSEVLDLESAPPPAAQGGRTLYVLPQSKIVCDATTLEEARGEAVLRAVRRRSKTIEEPITVIEVE